MFNRATHEEAFTENLAYHDDLCAQCFIQTERLSNIHITLSRF